MARPSPLQFFKVFLPELSSERLRIPPAFVKHIQGGGRFPITVSLKGPGGGVWYVDLVTNSGKVFIEKGWKEFIHDHSLQRGDFLVFKYVGDMQFDVLVFDRSACEKEAAILARPSLNRSCMHGDGVALKKKRGKKRRKTDSDGYVTYVVLERQPQKNKQTSRKEKDFPVKARQSGVMSQRRPVTVEEVDKVLLKAQAFKSKQPFCLIQMHDSYVYFSFALNMPMKFAIEHLPQPCGNVILWDPSGTRWEVKFIFYRRGGRFTAGWSKFSITNNLETGDVCVFEVVEKYEMKVHIFRVVEELTPLVRAFRAYRKQPSIDG